MKKITEKMTFNLSKKVFSILALFIRIFLLGNPGRRWHPKLIASTPLVWIGVTRQFFGGVRTNVPRWLSQKFVQTLQEKSVQTEKFHTFFDMGIKLKDFVSTIERQHTFLNLTISNYFININYILKCNSIPYTHTVI